jgi:hypothetical protein
MQGSASKKSRFERFISVTFVITSAPREKEKGIRHKENKKKIIIKIKQYIKWTRHRPMGK